MSATCGYVSSTGSSPSRPRGTPARCPGSRRADSTSRSPASSPPPPAPFSPPRVEARGAEAEDRSAVEEAAGEAAAGRRDGARVVAGLISPDRPTWRVEYLPTDAPPPRGHYRLDEISCASEARWPR